MKKVLVDTSVLIEFFKKSAESSKVFLELLEKDLALIHPKVIGELCCGVFKNREKILSELKILSEGVLVVSDYDCIEYIEQKKFYGYGLSFTDIHLLMTAQLMDCKIFTADKKLAQMAKRIL